MKKYFSVVVLCMLVVPAFGAGRSMVNNVQHSARAIVSPVAKANTVVNNDGSDVATDTSADTARATESKVESAAKVKKVNRDKEKLACTSNNIGIGNTFVWASKNSNTANYASMTEDVENPENNVCYVLVGMRSDDSRISTADIQPQYFEWGQTITCGSWVDEAKMEDRILEAKKSARTWGTIAGSVGGAGVGFGAMELFGNRLLSGVSGLEKLEGQRQFTQFSADWYAAKVAEMQKKDDANQTKYNDFVEKAKALAQECETNGKGSSDPSYAKCHESKYKGLWDYCMREGSGCKPDVASS